MALKSVHSDDLSILKAISKIYLKNKWFHLDPTFSKGSIYSGEYPELKYDINPQGNNVKYSDSRNLPFKDNQIKSIVFDPPFLFRNDFTKNANIKKATNKDKMCKRFSYFQNFKDLISMYRSSISEFKRVLENKGVLVFKCQDFTDGSGTRPFYDTHSFVIKIARNAGFSLQDIAILVKPNKLIQKGQQGCLRKIHSYYLVFKKEKQVLSYMKILNETEKEIAR